VSYLFGLVTVVLFTSQIAPLLLRVNLRDEAERLWRALGGARGQRHGRGGPERRYPRRPLR